MNKTFNTVKARYNESRCNEHLVITNITEIPFPNPMNYSNLRYNVHLDVTNKNFRPLSVRYIELLLYLVSFKSNTLIKSNQTSRKNIAIIYLFCTCVFKSVIYKFKYLCITLIV